MSSFLRNIYFFPVSFYPLSSFLRILSPISRLFLVSCLLPYWIWILSLVSFFYPLRSFLRILSPNFHLLLSSGFFLEDSVSYLPLSFYTFFFLEGAGYYLLFLSSILFLLSWGFCLLSPIFYLLSCGFSLLSPFSILWFFLSWGFSPFSCFLLLASLFFLGDSVSYLLSSSSIRCPLSWWFCLLSPSILCLFSWGFYLYFPSLLFHASLSFSLSCPTPYAAYGSPSLLSLTPDEP